MITITVNDQVHEVVEHSMLTYPQLVALAGMTDTPTVTVEWPNGSRIPSLAANRQLFAIEGLVVHVYHSANA